MPLGFATSTQHNVYAKLKASAEERPRAYGESGYPALFKATRTTWEHLLAKNVGSAEHHFNEGREIGCPHFAFCMKRTL